MASEGRIRGGSVVFPILLIAFGALFLLRRLLPDFDPWPVLWKYWPLFLILLGLGMLADRMNSQRHPDAPPSFPIGSTLGALAFVLVLGFLLSRHHTRHDWVVIPESVTSAHSSKIVERGDAKAVRIDLEMPPGELRIEGGSKHLLDANFAYGGAWSAPSVDYSVDKGIGELKINQDSGGHFGNSGNSWDLKLAENLPIELSVDIGAGKGDLRLAKVDLTKLDVTIGAGQVLVDLTGERGKDLQADIHGGVGEAIVKLPKNIGVVAEVHGGIGSIDAHGLKGEEDNRYVNEAYGKAPNTIHLTVEGGIGHIRLEQE